MACGFDYTARLSVPCSNPSSVSPHDDRAAGLSKGGTRRLRYRHAQGL